MTSEQVLFHIFMYGSYHEIPATDEETRTSLRILAEKRFIKLGSDVDPNRQTWVENKEVTEKILYPHKNAPVCRHCNLPNCNLYTPWCGNFHSKCWVEHTRTCQQCAVAIATEK